MTSEENRLEILKKVGDGTLSVEEGSDLIGILERAEKIKDEPKIIDPLPPSGGAETPEQPRVSGCWKAAWSMILLGGAVLTAFSAYWIYQGYQKAGLGWGFWLSWIPFLIGMVILVLGWVLMDSPWLHVRVHTQDEGRFRNIVISMPLPLRIASWAMRHFGQYMPDQVKGMDIEAMLNEIEQSLKRGEPFQVEVDDKEDGDQVYVYISK